MTQERPTNPTQKGPPDMTTEWTSTRLLNAMTLLNSFTCKSDISVLDGFNLHAGDLQRGSELQMVTIPVRSSTGTATIDCVVGFEELPERGNFLYCFANFPFKVPTDKRLSIAEFCVRASRELPIGRLELNMDNGEFCFHTRGLFGAIFPEPHVRYVFVASALTADFYLPAFMSVLFEGVSPKDAVEAVLLESHKPVGPTMADLRSFIFRRPN